jgi:ceramide glucosyltransferase
MDADMEVGPNTIQQGLSYLNEKNVGSAFYLPVYRGKAPLGGLLVEAYLNYHYNLYMGSLATLTDPPYIFGGLWMTRRSSLERTGGFETFGRTVSDDAAIGRAFLEAGLKNRLIPKNVNMQTEDFGLSAGVKHLGKWLGMLRAEGLGPYLAIWLWWHPVFWSAILLVLGLATGWLNSVTWVYGAIAIGFCLAAKAVTGLVLNRGVYRKSALHSIFFLFAYELFAIPVVFGIGLFRRSVTWKGRQYRLGAGGMVMGLDDSD